MEQDRAAKARRVRRRMADRRLAEQLIERGWKIEEPQDDLVEAGRK